MRVAYLGPEGTFTEEALLAAPDVADLEPIPMPSVYDAVMAVHGRQVERAIVPIENSLEGSVDATLDVLGGEAEDVAIVGESVHPIHHCLIARAPIAIASIDTVVSHAQANAQCARFIREQLAGARVLAASSTADAVRMVAEESDGAWAALGNRLAADLYGCEVLREGVEDVPDNETRFAWLALAGTPPKGDGPWKTSVLFWEVETDAPGWLVRCLAEFADRGVNLTRIESRPRRQGLGRYMFFADLDGRDTDPPVAGALEALRSHAPGLRVLGSYPAA